ncbi:MAG: TonB-dependent receptor, partial [Bacteroidota bacterium]
MKNALLFIITILIYHHLNAQTVDTLNIKEVEISSSRVPVLFKETARVVTVIDRSEIENAPVQSLQELLEYVLNVDVRQYGNHGVLADISIRGGSFDQAVILLNGVKVSDPQTGHHSLNIPVDLDNIKRIEILEGPGSRIYGANAFSGAINIITGSDKDKNVTASLSGGDFKLYNAKLEGTFNSEHIDNYLSLSRKGSSGYTENTDFKMNNAFYQTSFRSGLGDLKFLAGYNNKAFGAHNFYQWPGDLQFEKTKTSFANIRFSSGKKIKYNQNIYWRRHQDYYTTQRFDSLIKPNNHLTNIYGIDFNLNFQSIFGLTAIGAEYRYETILSNVLGLTLGDTIPVPGEPNWIFTHGAERENAGIFLEQVKYLNKFSISGGILANWYSDYKWNFYPGLDLGYQITKKIKLFSSINKSLRLPSFTDLYYKGRFNNGNPDLLPEEAISYEAGAKYFTTPIKGHVAIFRREGKNIIDWVRLPDSLMWESKNITELTTIGFEMSGNLNLQKIFKQDLVSNLIFTYSYIQTEKQSGEYISKYALD